MDGAEKDNKVNDNMILLLFSPLLLLILCGVIGFFTSSNTNSQALKITIDSSDTKDKWMNQVIEQINATWQAQYDQPINSQACKPTINAPGSFAMWRPMAEALGWPDEPIGWDTIVELAADPQGWASYGHPEWGRFTLGKFAYPPNRVYFKKPSRV